VSGVETGLWGDDGVEVAALVPAADAAGGSVVADDSGSSEVVVLGVNLTTLLSVKC